MLLVDETFETNQLRLILFIIVGITFINKNFLIAYSFIKSKAIILFNFFFDSFRYFVFGNDIVEPKVVLADQAAGLIVAMPVSMPNCLLQYCSWHVSQNIAKRLIEKRYLINKRKKIINYI